MSQESFLGLRMTDPSRVERCLAPAMLCPSCSRCLSLLPKQCTVAIIARETHADRLHFLIETQRLINAGVADADRVLSVVLERAQTVAGADGAAVELVEGDHLVRSAARGLTEGAEDLPAESELGLSGQCIRLATPLVCRDTETDGRVDRGASRRDGVRSIAVAPLVHAGQGVGVLKVVSAEPDRFNDADGHVLELMATFIVSSLASAVTFERDAERALRDPLTGLPSKILLMDRLSHGIYEAGRYGRHFGLFFIDLDRFSVVNDALGYEWGDAVLRAVAQGLKDTVRAGDTLARLDNDRFAIMAENADRSVVEERLRGRIDGVMSSVDDDLALQGFELTATTGVIWSSGHDDTPHALIRSAGAVVTRLKHERAARNGY
jgi:diguanylate cyclase